MKSLQIIQKTFRVFQTLSKIAMVLSFVWAGLAALGLLCGVLWYSGGNVFGVNQELLYSLTVTGGLTEMIGVLLVDMILALTDGTLLVFAVRYFKAEQADGSPFTQQGADRVLHLGILLIVLPAVATILVGVLHGIFDMPQIEAADVGNGTSVMMGIMLILVSLILRYGAEMEENRDAR